VVEVRYDACGKRHVLDGNTGTYRVLGMKRRGLIVMEDKSRENGDIYKERQALKVKFKQIEELLFQCL